MGNWGMPRCNTAMGLAPALNRMQQWHRGMPRCKTALGLAPVLNKM